MKKSNKWKLDISTIIGAVILTSIIIFIIFCLGKIGILNIGTPNSDTESVVAIIGMIGVLMTGAVSMFGILIKRSFDKHSLRMKEDSEKRNTIELEHNQAIREGAEKRLKMDTVINAVNLMDTENSDNDSNCQKVGALFALASLGQIELALALVEHLWTNNKINTGAAIWVVNQGLISNLKRNQIEAAVIICNNTDKLYSESGFFHWPESIIYEWLPDINIDARQLLIEALIKTIIGKPKKDWDSYAINGVSSMLHNIIIKDKNVDIRAAAACLQEFFINKIIDPSIKIQSSVGQVSSHDMRVAIETLEKDMGRSIKSRAPYKMLELVLELEKWYKNKIPVDSKYYSDSIKKEITD